jgi:hypothetical protein
MTILTIDELSQVYDRLPEAFSYGKPRDAFQAPITFPFMHTGSGKYEVVHTNIPAGTYMAFVGQRLQGTPLEIHIVRSLNSTHI